MSFLTNTIYKLLRGVPASQEASSAFAMYNDKYIRQLWPSALCECNFSGRPTMNRVINTLYTDVPHHCPRPCLFQPQSSFNGLKYVQWLPSAGGIILVKRRDGRALNVIAPLLPIHLLFPNVRYTTSFIFNVRFALRVILRIFHLLSRLRFFVNSFRKQGSWLHVVGPNGVLA